MKMYRLLTDGFLGFNKGTEIPLFRNENDKLTYILYKENGQRDFVYIDDRFVEEINYNKQEEIKSGSVLNFEYKKRTLEIPEQVKKVILVFDEN